MPSLPEPSDLPVYLTGLGLHCVFPAPALDGFVYCLWASGSGGLSAHTGIGLSPASQKLYPDGGVSLLIELHDTRPRATLWFNQRTQLSSTFPTTVPLLSARLSPGVLHALFGLSPAECVDTEILLSDVLEGEARSQFSSMLEELLELDIKGRMLRLEQWFSAYLQQKTLYRRRLDHLLLLLTSNNGHLTTVAGELGMSTRTLERHCLREIGMPPSLLQECMRMRDARHLLARNDHSMVDVALACGYYDQAHFSRAFADFVGETPGAYRRRKLSHFYKA